MSTSFHCQNCGSVTDVSNILRAFEENPHCPTCGMSGSESDAKMQDDLANLMARNLHLDSMRAPVHDLSMPPTPQVVPQPAPIAYVSQHYHHSSHLAPQPNPDDLPASTTLRDAGVNASTLLPCQLQLFRGADQEQKQRLIELWTIAPPTFGHQLVAGDMGNWPQTSMEQEEQAARERWHKQEQEKWKNLTVLPAPRSAEPYMMDGYGKTNDTCGTKSSQTEATGGTNGREWWNLSDDQPIEHQYGLIQQMRMQMEYYGNVQNADEMMT